MAAPLILPAGRAYAEPALGQLESGDPFGGSNGAYVLNAALKAAPPVTASFKSAIAVRPMAAPPPPEVGDRRRDRNGRDRRGFFDRMNPFRRHRHESASQGAGGREHGSTAGDNKAPGKKKPFTLGWGLFKAHLQIFGPLAPLTWAAHRFLVRHAPINDND